VTESAPAPGVGPLMAFGSWGNNAELIAAIGVHGRYLRPEWVTLDPTYGLGRFWRHWRPAHLARHDLDPERAPDGPADFTDLPYDPGTFDAVVFDPPYKLNGTSTGKGAAAADAGFGVASSDWSRLTLEQRHDLIRAGITECTRVLRPGGWMLVKCQDQVWSGKVRWQTREFADHAEALGHRLVDRFDLASYRPQPPGRRQVHARRNTSTLLVLRLENEARAGSDLTLFGAP
jgi:hypothetical protein